MKIDDLTQAQKDQLDDCKEMVARQTVALEKLAPAMEALIDAGHQDKLSQKHRSIIGEIMRWGDEDYDAFFNPPEIEGVEPMSIEDRMERTFAKPFAYFYFDRNNKRYQVYVEAGSPVAIRDEDEPDFF
jgi:hypothetical protein